MILLGLGLGVAIILPIFVLLVIEGFWKLKGFPRFLVSWLSAVPCLAMIYKGYLLYFFGEQYFGLVLLLALSATALLINVSKSFIPSK